MALNRKQFLANLGSGIFFSALPALSIYGQATGYNIDRSDFAEHLDASDEKYWSHIAKKYYAVSKSFINLEHGYFGVQPKPVFKAFQYNLELLNRELARFARAEYPEIFLAIRKELAAFLKVTPEEIIITRNATEALNIAIQGYPFKRGDEVIVSQLDYPSMIETFQMLEKRGEISVKRIELPLLPKTDDEIVDVYKNAISEKTKVILLTQVSNITGLILPVKKISTLAKEKNVDTIVDSAHALGQIPFDVPDLNSDFVGMNLHKWIGNPIGAGVLYIKKGRVNDMHRFWGDFKVAENDIMKLAHYGTTQFAVMLTIPASLFFHQQMGIDRISKRLHYLKSVWLNVFEKHDKLEVLTPADAHYSCAIASFGVRNKSAAEVTNFLMKEHKIFTVSRDIGKGTCIRVTPSLYNSESDMKKLITALNAL
jgi:selenocysteine lyase/cysteine desulfurase